MELTGNVLRAIFNSTDDVWFFVAPDMSIIFFNNKAFENGRLYHNKELKAGDNILDYARDTDNRVDQAFETNFKKAAGGHIVKDEQQVKYQAASIWLRSKYVPVYEKGSLLGISITVEDISREKNMEEDRLKFQEEILILSNKREEFINIASHELKTPLTSLKASLQIIEKMIQDDLGSLNIRPLIKKANSSITKLSVLVGDLLNINKIEHGGLSLEKTFFKLSDLINSCCDHVRMEGTHNIEVSGNLDLEVNADRNQIDQVMVNLVNNAVKYAPGSEEILVVVERQGLYAKISVKDFGPGVPPDQVNNIFERYYRGNEQDPNSSGMGLGLYISEQIIKRHNGQIGVETVGKGSTFWFTLPL